jgi:hypothetical protein
MRLRDLTQAIDHTTHYGIQIPTRNSEYIEIVIKPEQMLRWVFVLAM